MMAKTSEIYNSDWSPFQIGPCVSEWGPVERLAHLQLLFAHQPYFGRELRYFNQAPWWYRLEFETPAGTKSATLRFEGVNYCAHLAERRGSRRPRRLLRGFRVRGRESAQARQAELAGAKVSAPHELRRCPDAKRRLWYCVRNMVKGTYEHADTFVQRDVNPVGIWQPVALVVHQGVSGSLPTIVSEISASEDRADIAIAWPVVADTAQDATLAVRIYAEPEDEEVASSSRLVHLESGRTVLEADIP